VSVSLGSEASIQALSQALASFRAGGQVAELPSTPDRPIVVRDEPDRPQPILDCDAGGGNSVSVGRIRACALFDYKLVLLGHNTLRGAAGGAIHNAELLVAQGWVS
jgi:aspartate-semialdehyde dehydrogenase